MRKTLFLTRYKLAQFLIADEIFTGIISKPGFADLTALNALQHDSGFYLAALRIVESLTRLDLVNSTNTTSEELITKTLETKTLFLNRAPLTKADERDLKTELNEAKSLEDLIAVKLFDTLVLKALYDTCFCANAVAATNFTFLDQVDSVTTSNIPIHEFGLFDSSLVEKIEGLFDLTSNEKTLEVINDMKKHKYLSSYKMFLMMAEKFATVTEDDLNDTEASNCSA